MYLSFKEHAPFCDELSFLPFCALNASPICLPLSCHFVISQFSPYYSVCLRNFVVSYCCNYLVVFVAVPLCAGSQWASLLKIQQFRRIKSVAVVVGCGKIVDTVVLWLDLV